MIAAEVIGQVLAAGGRIAVDGVDLVLTAPRPLPADLLDRLKAHKAEIMEALAAQAEDLRAADYDDPALAPLDAAYRRRAAAEPGYEPAAQARYCCECANRTADKRCLAWERLGAPKGWKPADRRPRRCRGFELRPLAATLPGVSPEFAARLSAEDFADLAAGDLTLGTVQAFEEAAIAREAQDLKEFFEERAAVLEHDAGLARAQAQIEAGRMTVTLGRNRGCLWAALRQALAGCPVLLAQVPDGAGPVGAPGRKGANVIGNRFAQGDRHAR